VEAAEVGALWRLENGRPRLGRVLQYGLDLGLAADVVRQRERLSSRPGARQAGFDVRFER
jgi:hypothetical protein